MQRKNKLKFISTESYSQSACVLIENLLKEVVFLVKKEHEFEKRDESKLKTLAKIMDY